MLNTKQIIEFLKGNWFKVGIALILIYTAFRKDFSFNINLNTPVKIDNPEQSRPPAKQTKKKQTQERYTDNLEQEQSLTPNTSAMTDQFNFAPSISTKEEKKTLNAEKRLEGIEESKIINYIERFTRVAKAEQEKFGIPAAIILANGLLQSGAGTSTFTEAGHNYFGLTCTEDWIGEQGTHHGTCYRYYENAWTSFRDHSLYLTTGAQSQLKTLGSTDYKAWAQAIEKAKIGPEANWAEQMINVINIYHLDR